MNDLQLQLSMILFRLNASETLLALHLGSKTAKYDGIISFKWNVEQVHKCYERMAKQVLV